MTLVVLSSCGSSFISGHQGTRYDTCGVAFFVNTKDSEREADDFFNSEKNGRRTIKHF